MARLALGGQLQEFGGHVHERAQVPLGVVTKRGDELGGHKFWRTRLIECGPEALLQLIGAGALQGEPHADAAAKGEKLIGAEALDEPAIPGEYHGQENVAVEPSGGRLRRTVQHTGPMGVAKGEQGESTLIED